MANGTGALNSELRTHSLTERLYYNDAYLREFDARVLQCAPAGERWHVTLDRSAFYPASGGQPFDTGKLGSANVLEVAEYEPGQVVHVVDQPVTGEAVRGSVDWPRRFDHMQQHTGQHILSAAFVELFNFPTVSFHLGGGTCTIDLPQMPSAVQLESAEQRANEIVFENRTVEVMYGTADELAKLGIRKAVDRGGVLRAVCIRDFDRQPCGGTHVAGTGEVGFILLRKAGKQKQNWRIEFACGARAVRLARSDCAALTDAARLLSCGISEVAAGIRRTLEEAQSAHKRVQAQMALLAKFEAEALLRAAPATFPRRIVKVFEDAEAAYVRAVATSLAAQADVQAFLGTRAGGHVVFAQTPGLPGDMHQVLRAALQPVAGKGGGTRDFAQGSVADPAQLPGVLDQAASFGDVGPPSFSE